MCTEQEKRIVRMSGVGARHQVKSLGELKANRKWAKAFLDTRKIVSQKGIAILFGPRGTGKTQIGARCIQETVLDMFTAATCSQDIRDDVARYLKARVVGMIIRDSFSDKARGEQKVWKHFTRPDLLVIDELHERLGTDFEQKNLTHILDLRYDAMKPTILIANVSKLQLYELLGDSIMDRAREGGGTVEMNWKSLRY